jgi:hypothetical protein
MKKSLNLQKQQVANFESSNIGLKTTVTYFQDAKTTVTYVCDLKTTVTYL